MLIAGIVLYNPDIERLNQNIRAISSQVDIVVLIDNNSSNIEKINNLLSKYDNVYLKRNIINFGVAKALNQIVKIAKMYGASWVLTLDQDSVVYDGLIEEYEKYIGHSNIASLTCKILDRNYEYEAETVIDEGVVDFCITSGNYIRISAYDEVSGFDEKLFIDKVDTDFCYRLINSGWKIYKIPFVGLLHEVGENTKRVSLFGKKIVIFNHSAFRCYYIIRNQIYFARKHKKKLGLIGACRCMMTAWTRIFVYLVYERDKLNKINSWLRGIYRGYRMPLR